MGRRFHAEVFGREPGLETGFLSGVPVLTATPVPFWLFWPEKTVPSAHAVWASEKVIGSTKQKQEKGLSFLSDLCLVFGVKPYM